MNNIYITCVLRTVFALYWMCNMVCYPGGNHWDYYPGAILGPVSIWRPSYLRMAISMLKIRRPLGRLIFNMGITIPGKTVFLIETAPLVSATYFKIGYPYLKSAGARSLNEIQWPNPWKPYRDISQGSICQATSRIEWTSGKKRCKHNSSSWCFFLVPDLIYWGLNKHRHPW